VSWEPVEAPDHAESDGFAEWLYEVSVHNPGRFPIDNVIARLQLPIPVRRVRYSGRLGEETTTLTLRHPVLIGGDRRVWKRRIRAEFDAGSELKRTYSEVSFRDARGLQHELRWPRQQ
jgi:hypothetical protein